MRIGAGCDRRRHRRSRGGRLRRRAHGWHRRQHGRSQLHQVLQDRCAVRLRNTPLSRRSRRLRDGGGCRRAAAQASRRRRARRRPHLRRDARARRLERRQGQGHHRAQSGRAGVRGGKGVGERRDRPVVCQLHRRPRHVDAGRRRRRGAESLEGLRGPGPRGRIHPPRLREVKHRSPQERSRSCRHAQDRHGPRQEGDSAEPRHG